MPKVYHRTGKDDWGTPRDLFEILNEEFHFTLDACAGPDNACCNMYLDEQMDALSMDWWGRVFINPPFTLTGRFLIKMIEELVKGHIEVGVALVAARSDTRATFVASSFAGEIRFLKGRVRYLIYPTPEQRAICAAMKDYAIEPDGWAGLVKEIGLPKTAIQALMVDPTLPAGHKTLSVGAPFPSMVLIFDRREKNRVLWWDWKTLTRTLYVYREKPPEDWIGVVKADGSMLYTAYTME